MTHRPSTTQPFRIGDRLIGPGQPVFVIAEAGVNHNGQASMAFDLVRAAQGTGVDSIKFQTFKAEHLVVPTAPKARYQLEVTDPKESQLDMLRALELDEAAYPKLLDACKAANLEFLSTPYSDEDVEFLVRMGSPALKLASIHAAEPSFIRTAATTGKPLIVSTGMCTMDEVKNAVDAIRSTGNDNFVVLQCTTNYPSPIKDANLRAMITMRDQLGVRVGYSDHTQSNTACIAAVALGACVIEKHLTLDKKLAGPDHSCSLEPGEMTKLVAKIREAESAMGDGVKIPSPIEARNILGMRRGIAARRSIAKGAQITAADLILKRPLTEVPASAWDSVVGSLALRDIEADRHLTRADYSTGLPP